MLRSEVKSSHKNPAHTGHRSTPDTPKPALNLLDDGISLYLIRCVTDGMSTARYKTSNIVRYITCTPFVDSGLLSRTVYDTIVNLDLSNYQQGECPDIPSEYTIMSYFF